MKPRALYLHIPFCKAKCLYCDFDSRALTGRALEEAIDAYCERLSGQVDAHGKVGDLSEVETVYIGGGTPTLIEGRLVELVDRVRAYCEPVEFTCEANPESFTLDLAQALRAAGVTRISLGVQSLNAGELKAIGRIHSAEEAMLAVVQAKAIGFSTSCDVMCGLPGQTLDTFAETLRTLVTLNPDHVSVYPLQLEVGTPLARLEETGAIEVPDDDFQAQCMDLAAAMLEDAGYERYEVASYARSGYRCQHNIAYWTGKPYLGLGRSAASMFDVQKSEFEGMCPFACSDVQNEEDLPSSSDRIEDFNSPILNSCSTAESPCHVQQRDDTCARIHGEEESCERGRVKAAADGFPAVTSGSSAATGAYSGVPSSSDAARIRFKQLDDSGEQFETEELTAREAAAEDLMLACRMTDGISSDLLARVARVIPGDELSSACGQAVEKGLAVWDGGALKPTHLGWLEGNELFGIFWNLAYDS